MKDFEVHVSASYVAAGVERWNSFKEYVTAETAAEAKKQLKSELKADGYRHIEMDAIEC